MGYDTKYYLNPQLRATKVMILQGLMDVTTLNHPICVWFHRFTKYWDHPAWRCRTICTGISDFEEQSIEIELQLFKFIKINAITKELDMAEFIKYPS